MWTGSIRLLVVIATACLLLSLDPGLARSVAADQDAGVPAPYRVERLTGPARTVVTDGSGAWIATLTDGAYTVTVVGPSHTLSEPDMRASVTLTAWARLLAEPFDGTIDAAWLDRARTDTSPDVLQTGMQYVKGAPPIFDDAGQRISGDAGYGPLGADGARQEGSDFNDFLGVNWTFAGRPHRPDPTQAGDLDCSGFVRMVFGYRGGLPLGFEPDGAAIPRRAFQILDAAPGVITIPNQDTRVQDLTPLAAGDLVFFDADPGDGPLIDHVGIYLGPDAAGHPRFLSSRKTVNGPTLGDTGGRSTLDGDGLYARSFRAARRL